MLVRSNYVPKSQVEYCQESFTIKDALDKLNQTGYRCLPVLSNDGKTFIGNVYKIDVVEGLYEETLSLDNSIEKVLTEKDSTVEENTSFFQVFFTIKRLPYLVVISERGNFKGILTHAKVISLLEDSWIGKGGSTILTVALSEGKGSLKRAIDIISKYASIQNLITLDSQTNLWMRRVIVGLPGNIDEATLVKIKEKLDHQGLKVVFEDQITSPNQLN